MDPLTSDETQRWLITKLRISKNVWTYNNHYTMDFNFYFTLFNFSYVVWFFKQTKGGVLKWKLFLVYSQRSLQVTFVVQSFVSRDLGGSVSLSGGPGEQPLENFGFYYFKSLRMASFNLWFTAKKVIFPNCLH